MTRANPFAKAAANAATNDQGSKKKSVTIIEPEDPEIRQSIDEVVVATLAKNEADSRRDVAQEKVMPFALKVFIERYAQNGQLPGKLEFKGNTQKAALVIQDRSGQYNLSAEQQDALRTVLGDDAEGIINNFVEYKFNNDILNIPGVMEALGSAIEKLVSNKILTSVQKDSLLIATPRCVVKSGILTRLCEICDGDQELMQTVKDVLGSNIVSYLL